MNRYSMHVWLLMLLIGGMWFAPVAQANSCPRPLPSKYIPVLHLAEPIKHTSFDIREKGNSLEIHNLSSDAIFLANTQIDPTTTFTIDIHNAELYVDTAPYRDSCSGNSGIPDGEPVPQNIHTVFTVLISHELVNVPINIVYEANPDYVSDLRDYQEHEKQGKAYVNAIITFGAMMFVGQAVLIIAGIIGAIFLLRWMLRRAGDRWE
jgi:hypothetical protein